MKKTALKIFISLVSGFVLLWIGGWLNHVYFGKDRPIAIEVHEDNNTDSLQIPESLKEEIKIIHKKTEVKSLSSSRIFLFNRSGTTLKDIELHFEFENGKSKPLLISKTIKGPKDYPKAGITLLKEDKNSLRYKIDYFNNNDDPKYRFAMEFIFLGSSLPKITPKILEENVTIVSFDHNKGKWINNFLFFVTLIVFLFLYLVLFIWLSKKTKESKKKFIRWLTQTMDKILSQKVSLAEKEKDLIKKDFLEEYEKRGTSKFDTLYSNLMKTLKDDKKQSEK